LILRYLARNTGAPRVVDYLMERVATEKTAELRKQALTEVYFLQGVSNAQNSIAALEDRDRDARQRAIMALGACSDPRAEEALIGIVESDDPAATRDATIALARVGTQRCVDSLVALFRRLPRDARHDVTVAAALLALARIGPAQSLPLAAEELNASRSAFVNWACMLVIWQHGNEQHIDVVVNRLKQFILRKNRQDMEYIITVIDVPFQDELTAGVSFLQRFADLRVESFFEFLRANSSRLFEREERFLATHVPAFYSRSQND